MSNDEVSMKLLQLIGKAYIDKEYREKLHSDPDLIDDFDLSPEEYDMAIRYVSNMVNWDGKSGQVSGSPPQENDRIYQPYPREITERLLKLIPEIEEFAFEVFKNSITESRRTFSRISLMAYIIFGVGIFLFTLSAITGLMQGKEAFSISFGALGVISFVSFFILSPAKNVQTALSNLLQAEIIFMNFWNQLHFWTSYGTSKDPNMKEKGSSRLEQLTIEIVKTLEENLEGNNKKMIKKNLL